MGKNKNTPSAADLPALRIGSRLRCTDDGVEGRIAFANAFAVKIKWDDGQEVTWKRSELAGKPIAFLDAEPADPPGPTPLKSAQPLRATRPGGFAIPKRPRQPKVTGAGNATPKKLSALDAAAKVLAETGTPMSCQELIGAMAARGYWTSPAGKTPEATLCAAVWREVAVKGQQSRFVKTSPGRFALR